MPATFAQTLDDWHAKADGKCAIDYSYHLAVTEFEPKSLKEFKEVVDEGITTFKIFLPRHVPAEGELTEKQRIKTLAEMTEEEAALLRSTPTFADASPRLGSTSCWSTRRRPAGPAAG